MCSIGYASRPVLTPEMLSSTAGSSMRQREGRPAQFQSVSKLCKDGGGSGLGPTIRTPKGCWLRACKFSVKYPACATSAY